MHIIALALIALTLVSCQTSEHASKPTAENAMKITLESVSMTWLTDDERWELLVDVTFVNTSEELFQLDKVTACSGGRIQNHVFVVRHDETEVDYRGMMKKRAPPGPKGFHHLEPRDSVTERVDLGEHYDLPRTGFITVRFDHYNHFSPNGIQLLSNPVEIELLATEP